MQQLTHADLWAYVDGQGVTHFAAEPLDGRYGPVFRSNDRDAAPDSAARVRTYFDIDPGYKSVKRHLHAAARRHGVEHELLQAMIATESGFAANMVSPRGAVGLMQLMPSTAARFGVAAQGGQSIGQRLADPGTNVAAGARYLRHLLNLFGGRTDLALAAYNAGEGAVYRAGLQIPAYAETQNYVKSVLGLYAQLKPTDTPLMRRAAHVAARVPAAGTATPSGAMAGAKTEPQSNE